MHTPGGLCVKRMAFYLNQLTILTPYMPSLSPDLTGSIHLIKAKTQYNKYTSRKVGQSRKYSS